MAKRKNRFLRTIVVILMLLIVVFAFLPDYVRNALIYQYADTDDYKIFENRVVEADNPQQLPLSKKYNSALLTDSMHTEFADYETFAFVMVHKDSILFEKYFMDFDDTSVSNTFSATKSIIGLLVGCAIEDGFIDNLDQPVGDFINDFKIKQNSMLTIRHLLTMSSGIDFTEKYNSPFSSTTKAYYGTELEEQMKELLVVEKPGFKFKYLGANTQLLGMVISSATGKTLSSYASEKLWTPLGATHNALWSLDKKDGFEKAYCCFNATATDLIRVGMMMCDSGRWNGEQIIPLSYYLESIEPASFITDAQDQPVGFYGFHWWVLKYKDYDVIYARGLHGQYIVSFPQIDLSFVRLGKRWSDKYDNYHPIDLFIYLEAALELLENTYPDTGNR